MSTTASSYPSQLYHQSLYTPRNPSDQPATPAHTPPRIAPPPLPPHHHHQHHHQHSRPEPQPQPHPHQHPQPPQSSHQHPSFLRKDIYGGKNTSPSIPNPDRYPSSPSYPLSGPPSPSMTDSVYQQSKRLAGLSITNSSGNKVSILNDSPPDLDKASIKNEREYDAARPPAATPAIAGHPEHGLPPLRSPRSPHFRDRRDYFSEDRIRDPYYPPPHHHHHHHHHPSGSSGNSKSHRYRSESYEAGRSTSLTNAATPFRSGFDSRASEAAANSQRSRSLSSGAQLYPYSSTGSSSGHGMPSPSAYASAGASPMPYFLRAFSEDNASDEHEIAYRGLIGHPGLPEGLLTGPSFSKRKYSCTHPGCNKRFTTSGHLARHNRIHTGERNFSCLMPGCPSKFSRQDNMMQHYRTHISPKSRRGAAVAGSKKQDQQDEDGDEGEEHEHSPVALAAAGPSQHGSRHNSPPRHYPDQQETEEMDHDDRPSSRQQHQQHHSPEVSHSAHPAFVRERPSWSVPASPTSPMTQPVERMEDVTATSSIASSSSSSSSRDQQLYYYRQQQQYQQQYNQRQLQKQQQQAAASHASAYYHAAAATQAPSSHGQGHAHNAHGQGGHPHCSNKHLSSPASSSSSSSAAAAELHPHAYSYPHAHAAHSSSVSSSARAMSRNINMNTTMTPPSPQSTPVTPTKYRFDPIQDCLQQERRQREEATL